MSNENQVILTLWKSHVQNWREIVNAAGTQRTFTLYIQSDQSTLHYHVLEVEDYGPYVAALVRGVRTYAIWQN